MTIEQKAKAYDKALEKARIYRDNAKAVEDYSAVARYENIFPELHKEEKPLTPFQQCLNCILRGAYYAEVPDEKVNEFIVNIVRTRTDELIKLAKIHKYTDCQLHKSEDEQMIQEFNDWLCEEIECRTSDLRDEEDRRTLNMLCYILTKVKEWLEKHKEQKPNIEICPHSIKSKSYKENGYPIENCDYGLEIALAILEKTLGEVQGYQTDDGLREHQTAIKAVKDAMKEQKPTWSEEDTEMYINVASSLRGYACGLENEEHKRHIKKGLDWLENRFKSLRPQPNRNCKECAMFLNGKCTRPGWKPTEEHLSALLAVSNDPNNIGSQTCQLALTDLYEQLKKL